MHRRHPSARTSESHCSICLRVHAQAAMTGTTLFLRGFHIRLPSIVHLEYIVARPRNTWRSVLLDQTIHEYNNTKMSIPKHRKEDKSSQILLVSTTTTKHSARHRFQLGSTLIPTEVIVEKSRVNTSPIQNQSNSSRVQMGTNKSR